MFKIYNYVESSKILFLVIDKIKKDDKIINTTKRKICQEKYLIVKLQPILISSIKDFKNLNHVYMIRECHLPTPMKRQ